jgi:hypothetical protein
MRWKESFFKVEKERYNHFPIEGLGEMNAKCE